MGILRSDRERPSRTAQGRVRQAPGGGHHVAAKRRGPGAPDLIFQHKNQGTLIPENRNDVKRGEAMRACTVLVGLAALLAFEPQGGPRNSHLPPIRNFSFAVYEGLSNQRCISRVELRIFVPIH